MSRKKPTPWFSIVGGMVGTLTLLGILFGNVMAFGKQQAKQEEVEQDVGELKTTVAKQDDAIQEAQTNYKLIQKDMESVKLMQQTILDAVKKR
jgi:hypothetical protein